jgi:hypothetical protein
VVFDGGDFSLAQFSGGEADFSDAQFCDGIGYFNGVRFSGGKVDFTSVRFGGGKVDFSDAQFCDGIVDFNYARFSGGEIDFSRVYDCTVPPEFPWTDTPSPGVKLRVRAGKLIRPAVDLSEPWWVRMPNLFIRSYTSRMATSCSGHYSTSWWRWRKTATQHFRGLRVPSVD